MKTSETQTAITKAIVLAQAEITHATKDAKNPHFKSKYATLEAVIDASKAALLKNGINVFQVVDRDGFLTTRLQHESGEWVESEMTLMLDKQTMQSLGSAISYARRYALAAMLNIAQTDDDANEADQANNKQQNNQAQYFFPGGKNKGKHFSQLTVLEFNNYFHELKEVLKKETNNQAVSELIDLMGSYKREKGI
jgi:hypothetical protein